MGGRQESAKRVALAKEPGGEPTADGRIEILLRCSCILKSLSPGGTSRSSRGQFRKNRQLVTKPSTPSVLVGERRGAVGRRPVRHTTRGNMMTRRIVLTAVIGL